MAEKSKTPIRDYYQSLSSEPRGTMGKFILWLCLNTGKSDGAVRYCLKNESWSPIERAFIEKSIADGSWRHISTAVHFA